MTYKIHFETEDEEFQDVKITGKIPKGVELIPESISSSPAYPFVFTGVASGETVTWDLGTLPSNFNGHFTYKEVVRPTIPTTQLDSVLEIRARGPSSVPCQYTNTIHLNNHEQ